MLLVGTPISLHDPTSLLSIPLKPVSWSCQLLLLLLSCFSHVRFCATPETAAHEAHSSTPLHRHNPTSLGFFRQEHWSGLPFPSPMQESEK